MTDIKLHDLVIINLEPKLKCDGIFNVININQTEAFIENEYMKIKIDTKHLVMVARNCGEKM